MRVLLEKTKSTVVVGLCRPDFSEFLYFLGQTGSWVSDSVTLKLRRGTEKSEPKLKSVERQRKETHDIDPCGDTTLSG